MKHILNFKQFIKFSIVGFSNTLISFAITYGTIFIFRAIFKDIDMDDPGLIFFASFLGFVISVLNSYYWNNKYVFEKTSTGHIRAILKSYVCYGTIFIVAYMLNAFIFTKLLNLSDILIPILQIFICTPLNFLANKFWAFK